MKIVLNIPEEIKQKRDAGKVLSSEEIATVCMAIKNGTPLPKGHGRLVDEKDLSLMTVHLIDGMFVCDAPTIIEADKAEWSDKE